MFFSRNVFYKECFLQGMSLQGMFFSRNVFYKECHYKECFFQGMFFPRNVIPRNVISRNVFSKECRLQGIFIYFYISLKIGFKEQRRFQFTVIKITLSSFLVIVLVTSKYTKLFLFSFEHFRLRMKEEIDGGVVVHSLGFSAEGLGSNPAQDRISYQLFFLKKKYSPIQLLKIHVWWK
jgi:hypothetical protein